MKRLLSLVVGLAAFGLCSASPAAADIQNISPVNGAHLPYGSTPGNAGLRYTCAAANPIGAGSDWTWFFYEIATSPELAPDGTLATAFEVDSGSSYPTNAAGNECQSAGYPTALNPGTYYWQVEDVSCGMFGTCDRTGPVWSFIIDPPPPAGPAYKAYTACGTSGSARPSSSCGARRRKGAFFRSNHKDVHYKVCVKFPSGKRRCTGRQFARKGELYVNPIASTTPGRHRVTWSVGGRQVAARTLRVHR